MQKLITVSVDTKQLVQSPTNPFSINEVDSINEFLEQGWEIEDWDFLLEDAGDGKILLLVTLNDDAMFDREVDEFDDEYEEEEDDMEDEEEEDIEEEKNL